MCSRLGGEEDIFVVYWHTVEGRLYDYGARFNAIHHPWLWWRDAVTEAVGGSREQLFVRISSEQSIEELWRDHDFVTVVEAVASLGLWDEKR